MKRPCHTLSTGTSAWQVVSVQQVVSGCNKCGRGYQWYMLLAPSFFSLLVPGRMKPKLSVEDYGQK